MQRAAAKTTRPWRRKEKSGPPTATLLMATPAERVALAADAAARAADYLGSPAARSVSLSTPRSKSPPEDPEDDATDAVRFPPHPFPQKRVFPAKIPPSGQDDTALHRHTGRYCKRNGEKRSISALERRGGDAPIDALTTVPFSSPFGPSSSASCTRHGRQRLHRSSKRGRARRTCSSTTGKGTCRRSRCRTAAMLTCCSFPPFSRERVLLTTREEVARLAEEARRHAEEVERSEATGMLRMTW